MNAQTNLEPGLETRASAVLAELVAASYLAEGTPVASRTIAESHPDGWSPATIRAVMAELEELGFLRQPHTSAGRVPTAKATRWWIQRLTPPAPLPLEQRQQLERALQESSDEATLWTRATEYVARLSHQLGVAGVQPWMDTGLREIRFFRLTEHRVLAILVASDGKIRERIGRLPEVYAQSELDAAARYFTMHFPGATLARIRRELERRLQEERSAYDALLKRVLVLYHCGLLEMQDQGALYVQGASQLSEAMRSESVAGLLRGLGEKERWLHLLGEMGGEDEARLDWEDGGSDLRHTNAIRVRVGLEREQLPEFSLVTAACRVAEHGEGVIGVVGPTCMGYAEALRAVTQVRDSLQRVLGAS